MQTDPIGYEDQYNLYAYVGNDPANAIDPSGESSKCSVNACDSNGLDGLEGVRGSGSRIGSIVVGAQSSTLAANGSKPQSGQQGRANGNSGRGMGDNGGPPLDDDESSIVDLALDVGKRVLGKVGGPLVALVTPSPAGEGSDIVVPPLRGIHSESAMNSPAAIASREFWSRQSTRKILDSLRPGQTEALRVKPDGRVFNGHQRLQVLRERGINVNALSREILN